MKTVSCEVKSIPSAFALLILTQVPTRFGSGQLVRKADEFFVCLLLQLIKGNEKNRFMSLLFNWEVSIW